MANGLDHCDIYRPTCSKTISNRGGRRRFLTTPKGKQAKKFVVMRAPHKGPDPRLNDGSDGSFDFDMNAKQSIRIVRDTGNIDINNYY